MVTKYIENPGRDTIYVGGKMIPPGEGRDVDVQFLPPELKDPETTTTTAEPSLADLLTELLGKSVKAITAELPTVTHEALDLLADLEGQAEAPRTSLLGAIKAEQLRRANHAKEEIEKAAHAAFLTKVDAAYEKALQGLTPEELAAIGEDGKAQMRSAAEESVRVADATPPAA